MTLRVLIVDDEPLAREGVRRLLEKSEGIEIVGECSDGVQAIEAIHSIRPDLVFLDIQMPEVNGFDVIQQVGTNAMPAVVFVTAYDEFALKAFNVHALDYLLKPVDPARLAQSVARAMSHLSGIDSQNVGKKLQALLDDLGRHYPDRIMVKTPGRITFLNVDEVDWIEAEGDYVCFHAGGRKHLIRDKIGEVENRLNPDLFARIHRSSIVRLARIKELQPMFSGEYTVLLSNGEKLTMSRTYRDRVLATLNQTGKHR
jgi:two-component system LytT family response regulator